MLRKSFICLALAGLTLPLWAETASVTSPDGLLKVTVDCTDGKADYQVTYDNHLMVAPSALGLRTDIGDLTQGLTMTSAEESEYSDSYVNDRIKRSHVDVKANVLTCNFSNGQGNEMQVEFRVSNNDVAFRYILPRQVKRGSVRVLEEATGFKFPEQTTSFITPQSDAMIGWKRSKPSYEEEYVLDAPLDQKSQYGHGYTFPALFRVGNDGWVLVSETGLDRNYCATHLSDWSADKGYTIAFPMPEENNGNGTAEPAFALPGATPWRTLTIGADLAPIVETTIPWDVTTPRYNPSFRYEPGKGTWSWIVWQDDSMNERDQKIFIDLAAQLGYDHILVDAGWDKALGKEGTEKLVEYARSKGVDVYLWLSSSGYWNDIEQSPINIIDNPITRKKAMKWMHSLGVKGIKVDFFGGDKQETIRLYEDILSDADDNGLMVIFHGCTLPRGWEKMYPNYIGSEAVLASENLIFQQHFCDKEAENAALHPFIRNAVASMEFGGTILNKRLNRGNNGGTTRRTGDGFEIATAVLFQNPAQNFALTPENMTQSPEAAIRFMKQVPTRWDDTRFIDGYPGKYIILARRHDNRWYVAGINAQGEPLTVKVNLDFTGADELTMLADTKAGELKSTSLKLKKGKPVELTIPSQGGVVIY